MQHQLPQLIDQTRVEGVLRLLGDHLRVVQRAVLPLALSAVALALAGCADQDASYLGAKAIDPSQQSGLGNPDRDRPVVLTPPPKTQDSNETRFQWNGNPQRVIEGKSGAADAKPPKLKPQPPSSVAAGGAGVVPNDAQVVEVLPGDTLHGIAERYGVTVASLNQANALSGAPLRPGQRLTLPPAAR